MKPDEKRILKELQEMIADQVMESKEVDVSAKEIFDKFVKPLLGYLEIKAS